MKRFPCIFLLILVVSACAPAIKLKDGEYYMASSKFEIPKNSTVKTSDVSAYAKAADIYSEQARKSGEENIQNHLQFLGYYGSEVTSDVVFKKKRARVTYHIVPGERYTIDSLIYNVSADSSFIAEFNRDLKSTLVAPGDYLSESALTEESKRSSENFRNRGYYGFNAENYSFVADTLSFPGRLLLEYNLKCDTPKYRLGEISVSYPESIPFRDTVLRGLLNLRPGMMYGERRINNAYNRLSNLFVFNNANIELTPRDSTDIVDCAVKLQPSMVQGVRFNFEASVNASGLLSFSPQLNYYHNNIFHGGERLNVGFSANLQYRPSDKSMAQEYSASVGFTFPKFLGLGYKHFWDSNVPKTDIKTSFSYQNRPEYTRTILSLNYAYSGSLFRPQNYLTYQFSALKLNAVRLPKINDDFMRVLLSNPLLWYSYIDHLDAGVNGTIYFSNAREVMPKRTYRYLRASLDLSGNLLSLFNFAMPTNETGERTIFCLPYMQYARTEISLGYTIRFGKKDEFSLASRVLGGVGLAYGNSKTMPFEQQFYCGGANSMRGWNARCLGPGTSVPYTEYVFPSQVGDMKLEADVEFRFPIVWKLEGAAFAETGNVWLLPRGEYSGEGTFKFDTFAKQLAVDWGLGLRLNMDFLLIRLDMGLKLRDPSDTNVDNGWRGPQSWFNKDGFAVHFGVGYPF